MRVSNRKAVLHLLKNGYDDIWLKPHGRRHDLVYNTGEWYRALDLWNLFDGICFDQEGIIILLLIKTNAWAKEQPIKDFLSDKNNLIALSINVKYGKKWTINIREYKTQIILANIIGVAGGVCKSCGHPQKSHEDNKGCTDCGCIAIGSY